MGPTTVILIQAIGLLTFLMGSVWLGARLRHHGNSGQAESLSRISHGLFWIALMLPAMIGLFYPGLSAYDGLFGMPGLPVPRVSGAIGALLLAVGVALMAATNRSLFTRGGGAAAFMLTERLVEQGLYGRTRNPMSLGFYAACVGAGMIAGSLTVTLGVLLVLVPVHAFNLKYFEERELALRYGDAYTDYRRRVPFLIPRSRRNREDS